MSIRYLPEEISRGLISHELAYEAVSAAFLAAARTGSATFPVLLGHGGDPGNRFSIKSAAAADVAGLKIGSYWPGNPAQGMPRHSSCILLFDQSNGRIDAVIEASIANAYRTAAGDAVAVHCLARSDARHLAIFGAGHQARFECEALLRVRPIRTISIVNRSPENGRRLAQLLEDKVDVLLEDAETACRKANIVVTVTDARTPLFDADWIRPGTHVSCMGADARGKQETPVPLLLKSDLFSDFVPQSLQIGEFQHIASAVERGLPRPVNIGDVLSHRANGRRNAEAITVFDSSGLALQDLCLARRLLEAAQSGKPAAAPAPQTNGKPT